MKTDRRETWYSYECSNQCPTSAVGTGVIIDLRLPTGFTEQAPDLPCPVCGGAMRFRGFWRADDGGYGSLGDNGHLIGFIEKAEHAPMCTYRQGYYDESARCDCGLVALRKQLNLLRS